MSPELYIGVIVAVAQAINVWFTGRMRADIAEVKLELTEKRHQDREEIREWVDAEFMRRAEIEAKLEALKATR